MIDMRKVFDTISINGLKYADKSEVEKNLKKYNDLELNIFYFISLPPPNTSEQTLMELNYLSSITRDVTQEQIDDAMILDDKPHYLHEVFLNSKGLEFPKDEFNEIWKTIGDYVMLAKWTFNRPRPAQLAERLGIEITVNDTETAQTPAYPSGHTAYAKTSAMLLSKMYPEFAEEFEKSVDIVNQSRIILGLHYPSDGLASVELVSGLFRNLTQF